MQKKNILPWHNKLVSNKNNQKDALIYSFFLNSIQSRKSVTLIFDFAFSGSVYTIYKSCKPDTGVNGLGTASHLMFSVRTCFLRSFYLVNRYGSCLNFPSGLSRRRESVPPIWLGSTKNKREEILVRSMFLNIIHEPVSVNRTTEVPNLATPLSLSEAAALSLECLKVKFFFNHVRFNTHSFFILISNRNNVFSFIILVTRVDGTCSRHCIDVAGFIFY
jgi:hypothetical protein